MTETFRSLIRSAIPTRSTEDFSKVLLVSVTLSEHPRLFHLGLLSLLETGDLTCEDEVCVISQAEIGLHFRKD